VAFRLSSRFSLLLFSIPPSPPLPPGPRRGLARALASRLDVSGADGGSRGTPTQSGDLCRVYSRLKVTRRVCPRRAGQLASSFSRKELVIAARSPRVRIIVEDDSGMIRTRGDMRATLAADSNRTARLEKGRGQARFACKVGGM